MKFGNQFALASEDHQGRIGVTLLMVRCTAGEVKRQKITGRTESVGVLIKRLSVVVEMTVIPMGMLGEKRAND